MQLLFIFLPQINILELHREKKGKGKVQGKGKRKG